MSLMFYLTTLTTTQEPDEEEGVWDAEPEADVRGGADGAEGQGLPQPHEHHHRRGQVGRSCTG